MRTFITFCGYNSSSSRQCAYILQVFNIKKSLGRAETNLAASQISAQRPMENRKIMEKKEETKRTRQKFFQDPFIFATAV